MKKKIFWIITFISIVVYFYFHFTREINDFNKKITSSLLQHLEGLNYYLDEKYSEAEYKFIKAKSIAKDPCIVYYSNLYINCCDKLNFKNRDINFIEEHFNYIKKYKAFSNRVEDIWWMLSSNISNIQDRKKAIHILEKYIKEAKYLTKENQLNLRVIIKTLKMANQEYGDAIYGFYKIIYETKHLPNSI